MVLLLQRSDLRVNQKDALGFTAFNLACSNGRTAIIRLMLKDERVNINIGNKLDQTPLWIATYWENIDIVKMLFASGRKIVDCDTSRRMAREKEYVHIWEIIKSYMENPAETSASLREEVARLGAESFLSFFPLLRT